SGDGGGVGIARIERINRNVSVSLSPVARRIGDAHIAAGLYARGEIMKESGVEAALFKIEVGLRGVGDERADAEEIVLGAPQVVEPDVGMGLLVKDLRDVGFALEAAIEVRRSEGGG